MVPDVYVTDDNSVIVEVGDIIIREERGFTDRKAAQKRADTIALEWGLSLRSSLALCSHCGQPLGVR